METDLISNIKREIRNLKTRVETTDVNTDKVVEDKQDVIQMDLNTKGVSDSVNKIENLKKQLRNIRNKRKKPVDSEKDSSDKKPIELLPEIKVDISDSTGNSFFSKKNFIITGILAVTAYFFTYFQSSKVSTLEKQQSSISEINPKSVQVKSILEMTDDEKLSFLKGIDV